MKLSREELEIKVLKHLTTDPKAIIRAKLMRITADHFVHVDEGGDSSFTKSLFALIDNYYDQSGGSLVTSLVLENKIVQYNIKDKVRGKLLILWSKVQEDDYDENELYDLLQQLKTTYAVKLWQSMITSAKDTMVNTGVLESLEVLSTQSDAIRNQLVEIEVEQQKIDVADSWEYFYNEYKKRQDNPEKFKGIYCGLPELDVKTFGWMPGQVIVLLAPSSGGKSVQLLNWAHYAHKVQGKNVLYFSFEMPLWLCLLRHISLAFDVPYDSLKGITYPPAELESLVSKMKGMEGGPYFEYDVNMDDATPEYIDSRIRELTTSKGKPDIVIADYIGNMSTRSSRPGAPPWEKQGDAFERLFILARRHEIPILTAQQINRDAIKENRKQKQSGKSAAYYQDASSGDQRMMHLAHFVIAMDPDKEKGCTTYYPVKMRDAFFIPFGAHVDRYRNMIVPMSAYEQDEWRRLNSLGGENLDTSKPNHIVPPKVKPFTNDSNVTVEWSGSEVTLTPDDLTMNWEAD